MTWILDKYMLKKVIKFMLQVYDYGGFDSAMNTKWEDDSKAYSIMIPFFSTIIYLDQEIS